MKKTRRFTGLKAKATVYMVIPVVISFIIVYVVLFISLSHSQQNLARAEFQNIVRKHASNSEEIINNAVDYMSSVADIIQFQINENATDRESLQKWLLVIFERYGINSSDIYFEPDMYDGKDAEYIGSKYGTSLSGRISYHYVRSEGKTVYMPETPVSERGLSLPMYINVKEKNAPMYTAPTLYEKDGEGPHMAVFIYPLHGRNNEFVGAVTAEIFIGSFYEQIHSEKIFTTGYMIVEDDKGMVIYSPRFRNIGKTREEAGLAYPLPSDNEETIFFRSQSILNAKDTLMAINALYIPRLGSHFYVSVSAPIEEINAKGLRLVIIIMTISAAFLLLPVFVLYSLAGKLTKPIEKITESAAKIARGDYNTMITGNYKDEFGVLQKTVNSMIMSIRSYIEESGKSLNVLKSILSGLDSYIYVSNPETHELLFINDRLKNLFGFKHDVVGQCCHKLFKGLDEECEDCPCRQLNDDPDKIIVWEKYDNLNKAHFRHTDCYIDWLDGKKVHLEHSVDLSDIKRITEEKIRAESEARELALSKEHAEATSRMKSVFLASMSHEIRTPMHGIIGFSELALEEEIPQKTKNYLSKIKTSAEGLLMIINDILDVSKIEAGKMELEKTQFELTEVFKYCRMVTNPKAREKGLTLFCYAEPSIGRMLVGDPTKLRQILLNLLANAVKFTNDGIVKLQSAIVETTEDTITMHFEVKDSGIGMTSEQLARIFQPFMQADDTTTRKYGGTGLGLAITKGFVELMGSKLKVESTLGLGSKFSFDLTFETVAIHAENHDAAKAGVDERPVFEGEVLICEDNTLNQIVIIEHLSKVGLKSVIAENGKIGLDLVKSRMEEDGGQYREKPFDLIFMDIHMPEMDGLEAAKKIIEAGCNVPIIALTANIMTDDQEMYFTSGMCDCLPKPFVSNELWACLLKYLQPVKMLSIKKEADFTEEDE